MMGFSNSFVSLAWKIWLVFGYVKFQGCKGFIECTFRGSIMYFMGANSWKIWRLFIYEKQGILWIMSLFAASCPWMKRRKGTRRIGEFYGCLKPQWGGCTFVNHAIPSNWISFRNPPFQPIWFFGIITKGPLFFQKCVTNPFEPKLSQILVHVVCEVRFPMVCIVLCHHV